MYCQLLKWRTRGAILTTYSRTMLFVREGQTLRCSRLYRHDETGPTTTPRILAAMLLALASEVTAFGSGVRFGNPCSTPAVAGYSPLWPPNNRSVAWSALGIDGQRD